MKNFHLLIVFVLLSTLTKLPAQTHAGKLENFEEGQYFFNREEYTDALYFYQTLLDSDSLNANLNFKAGTCYLKISGKENLAVPYLEHAILRMVPKKKYNGKDFNEKNAPIHAIYFLGNAYRIDNQLNKALDCYTKFIESPYFLGNYNQGIVEQEMKSCERAKIIQDAPLVLDRKKLPASINTNEIEEKPVISGDDSSLVFVRKLKFYDAIFYSVREDGEWKEAININPQILSDGEFYPTGLSAKGNQLLLVKNSDEGQDIYISKLENGIWSVAKPLSGRINSNDNESWASFSNNDQTILLSSDKHGGRGGFDIYSSDLSDKGVWSAPKNIGKLINTEFDDMRPAICANDQILFFSSKGHYNMGGFDIFYAKRNVEEWSVPINIGFPLNDTRDNFGFYPIQDGRKGYYTFDSEHDGFKDIYYVVIKSESVLFMEKKDSDE